LVHDQEYAYHATAVNGTTESPITEVVTAVADSVAPIGDQTLTAEVVE
jgi:hypothetical protein